MNRLICLGLLLLLSLQVRGQSRNEDLARQFNARLEPLHKKIHGFNTLNYGDQCSYEAEQERIRRNKQIYDSKAMITDPNLSVETFHQVMYAVLEQLSNLRGQFCNGYKALACNSTGQCFCGAGHMYLDYNLKYDFVLEEGKCVLAEGSICASDNFLNEEPLFGLPKTEHRCRSSSPCQVRSSGKPCEKEPMNLELQRMASKLGRQLSEPELIDFILQKYKEGVCVCKGCNTSISTVVLIIGLGSWIVSKSMLSV